MLSWCGLAPLKSDSVKIIEESPQDPAVHAENCRQLVTIDRNHFALSLSKPVLIYTKYTSAPRYKATTSREPILLFIPFIFWLRIVNEQTT